MDGSLSPPFFQKNIKSKQKDMNKYETLKALNVKIDQLILKGLDTTKRKEEFTRLCKIHKMLILTLEVK